MERNDEWYLQKVLDLLEMSPWEEQFQSFLVYPILEKAVSEKGNMKVIDCHNFRQYNTKNHTRCQYSVLVKAVPDLLIAKNFVYHNRFNVGEDNESIAPENPGIVAAVEVKAPNSGDMCRNAIGGFEYSRRLYAQIFSYLYKNKKVILTNAYIWEFFDWEEVKKDKSYSDLECRLEEYMEILELCGFDNGSDFVSLRPKKLKEKIVKKKWGIFYNLKKIGALNFLDESLKNITESKINKDTLSKIVNLADDAYYEDIRKCVAKARKCSINIISNSCELAAEQYGKNPIREDREMKIKSISDFKLGEHKLENLYKQLNSFLT